MSGVVSSIVPTWFFRPSSPIRAVLSVTRRCNMRCTYCHTYNKSHADEMTAGEIALLMDGMPKLMWLDITGGEPFFRKDIMAVFDSILRHGIQLRVLHFATNGAFGDTALAVANQVKKLRPDLKLLITVSVDGPPELHDKMRGKKGAFDLAIDTANRLLHVDGANVYIGTTIGPNNHDSLDELGDLLHERIHGFDPNHWHWNWLQISDHFFGNKDLAGQRPLDDQLINQHLRHRWPPKSAVDLMEMLFLLNLRGYLAGEPSGIPCQSLLSACFIAPDATLYPCHVYDRPLANLRLVGFDMRKVWASTELKQARQEIDNLICGGCFTPCEAYPAISGSPGRSLFQTLRRLVSSSHKKK